MVYPSADLISDQVDRRARMAAVDRRLKEE
jgi:hypothetical protein